MGMRRRCASIPASTICLKQRRGHLISKLSLKFPDKQREGGGGIKTKIIKVTIFKKQTFCSEFKYKSHESSRF